jgi:signal transduction histidine kinase
VIRTPLPGTLGRIAEGARARLEKRGAARGLRGKLWVAFVLQVVAISLATLLGVYGAEVVLRDVLIQRALTQEAQHYWQRLERDAGAALPDTYNMRGFLRPVQGSAATVPGELAPLAPGYHRIRDARGHDDLVYVSDGPQGRLWLVFAQEQVNRLAFWFGLVPLTFVLLGIYLASWYAYRRARSAVSPVIWLANQVRALDPKHPELDALAPENLPAESDHDVRFLAGSIHGFAQRLDEFVERERNFTRDASHELRSPLTVIKVAADVMLADSALEPFEERSLTRIKRAAKDMEALIEAFLILAREDDIGLPDEDFVANEAVAEEVERARDLVARKPVELRQVFESQFALHAPLRVFSVMVGNLLRNACTYTEQGTVTVTVGRDFVRVADSGPGMAPEELAQVFQPYFRGRAGGSGGHGIGLTIVKRLSDRFRWVLELESRVGEGTTATIRFPHPQPV